MNKKKKYIINKFRKFNIKYEICIEDNFKLYCATTFSFNKMELNVDMLLFIIKGYLNNDNELFISQLLKLLSGKYCGNAIFGMYDTKLLSISETLQHLEHIRIIQSLSDCINIKVIEY